MSGDGYLSEILETLMHTVKDIFPKSVHLRYWIFRYSEILHLLRCGQIAV